MSDFTETYLDVMEMVLAGILVEVIRPDGETGYIPNPDLLQADLNERLDDYRGSTTTARRTPMKKSVGGTDMNENTAPTETSEKCQHTGEWFWVEEGLCCSDCYQIVAVSCPLCGGQGFMSENDMECDWINYDDRIVTCRECGGKGWTSDPSFQ